MDAKIKTYRPKSFRGDSFVRVDLHRTIDGKTQIIPQFGLWPVRKGRSFYYECDSMAKTFPTIAQAKTYAMEQAKIQGLC